MKVSTWMVALISLSSILSCVRDDTSSAPESSSGREDSTHPVIVEQNSGKKVKGNASFGSQCPYGMDAFPKSVDITLEDCPIELSEVELVKPLPPLVLQADCIKKTIDIRGITPASYPATNWEFMPDGSFYFKVDGGSATLRNDGAGNANCTLQMTAEMWGKVDCTHRDKAVIKVETLWWLGATSPSSDHSPSTGSIRPLTHLASFEAPITAVSPLPVSFASPMATPSPLPSASPLPMSSPVPVETPIPSPSPFPYEMPSPLPSDSPSVIVSPPATPPRSIEPLCKLPKSCYFHNIAEIHQCE